MGVSAITAHLIGSASLGVKGGGQRLAGIPPAFRELKCLICNVGRMRSPCTSTSRMQSVCKSDGTHGFAQM